MNITKEKVEGMIIFTVSDPQDADEQEFIMGLRNAFRYHHPEPKSSAPIDQFLPGFVYQQLEWENDKLRLIMLKDPIILEQSPED